MIRSIFLTAILATALVFTGCQAVETPADQSPHAEDTLTTEMPADQQVVDDVGTITYVDLEGGFYGIVTDDEQRYNPKELDDEFKEDGLRVRFRGVIDEEMMTAQMWGENLEITEIMKLQGDF